jgi:hypothetical protein
MARDVTPTLRRICATDPLAALLIRRARREPPEPDEYRVPYYGDDPMPIDLTAADLSLTAHSGRDHRHCRDSGARPVRRRGSRRGAATRAGPGDGDGDPEPPGVTPQAGRHTAEAAA